MTSRERILDTLWRGFVIAVARGDIVSAYGFAARIRRMAA